MQIHPYFPIPRRPATAWASRWDSTMPRARPLQPTWRRESPEADRRTSRGWGQWVLRPTGITWMEIASGNLTYLAIYHSYWNWPCVVTLSWKIVIFHSYVKSPEGKPEDFTSENNVVLQETGDWNWRLYRPGQMNRGVEGIHSAETVEIMLISPLDYYRPSRGISCGYKAPIDYMIGGWWWIRGALDKNKGSPTLRMPISWGHIIVHATNIPPIGWRGDTIGCELYRVARRCPIMISYSR